jgi:CARDB protein
VNLRPPDLLKPTGQNHVFVAAGIVPRDSAQTRSFVLPTLTQANVLLLGRGVSWTLRSPGGAVIAPRETGKHPGYEFAQGRGGLATLRLDDPKQGMWTVTIANQADTSAKYGIDVWTEGPADESAHLEIMSLSSGPGTSIVARPGDAVYVRTFVANRGKPLRATHWNVRARMAPDSEIAIPVFDDGAHADGAPNDGVAVGAIVVEGQDGFYDLRAEGGTLEGTKYTVTGTIQVHGKSDLLIADSIQVDTRDVRAGAPATLAVTGVNDGAVEFRDATLRFYVNGVKVSEESVRLAPGESRRLRVTWMPPRAGSYSLQLTLASPHEPYWSNFKNNTQRLNLTVR